LFQRIGTVVLSRFVRNGKMRKNTFRNQPGQAACAGNMPDLFFSMPLITEKTKARHTGIHLDMDTQRAAERGRSC
jgi:hypothetical protein